MSSITLSYSLTLPQSIYPHLNYLMSVNKRQIKSWIPILWNNQILNKLKQTGKALTILKPIIKRQEKWIPSRIYRNSLELTGQILRSQIERKEIYEYIANHPCTLFYNENYLANFLEKPPLFILNIQRQLRKQIKKGQIEKDYLKVVKPDFNADIFITSADDSVNNGQFKKLEFYRKNGLWFMRLKIKLPTVNQKFEWFEIKKVVPNKIAKILNQGAKAKAPLIKKKLLSNGYEIFKLLIPFEIKVNKLLYQEQKRKQRKIKQIRKEVLEIFTKWIIEYARSYGIKIIAIEKLSFKNIPSWRSIKAIKRFTDWFYSKVKEKLEYKARLKGIRIIEINPANTSRYCHRCGRKGKAEKLIFKCECGKYDRDYNASVNIGKRAIKIIKKIKEKAGKSKSQGQSLRDTPARNPFRQGLASFTSLLSITPLTRLVAYSGLVEVSAIKLKKLIRWIDLHDYRYG